MNSPDMTSSKPYLIRAIYEWISDNELTPYVLVNTAILGCRVPQKAIQDDRTILNMKQNVVSNLVMNNQNITFTARFSGIPSPIFLPIGSIMAIYAKENGEGMSFVEELGSAGNIENSEEPDDSDDEPDPTPPRPKGKPFLKIVE